MSRNAHCGSSKTYATWKNTSEFHIPEKQQQQHQAACAGYPQVKRCVAGGTGAAHTQLVWPSNSAAAWSSTCWSASSLETPLAKVEASAWTWGESRGQRSCSFTRDRGQTHHVFVLFLSS